MAGRRCAPSSDSRVAARVARGFTLGVRPRRIRRLVTVIRRRTHTPSLGRTPHAKRLTPMSTRTTRTLRTWRRLPDATAGVLFMALACGTMLAESATCQTLPPRAPTGIEAADSLLSSEFAKDSLGSITVGVIADSRLAWTRSVGF